MLEAVGSHLASLSFSPPSYEDVDAPRSTQSYAALRRLILCILHNLPDHEQPAI